MRRPNLAIRLLRAFWPAAERDEVAAELLAEFEQRRKDGPVRAGWWLWRQVLGSAPWLLRRSWRRGWTGWESEANRWRGGSVLESGIVDVRHAVRRLRRRAVYALLAVLTLALGVGGTAAVYSLVSTLLFDPLPYEDPGELTAFWMQFDWSEAEYEVLRETLPIEAQGLAAYRNLDVTHVRAGAPAQLVRGMGTSATLFDVLGVRPMLGVGFTAGDDRQGAEPVVVLSHAFWRQLGGDPSLVGDLLSFGGVQRRVVGVMPPGFWFPDPSVRVWMTMQMNPANRSGNYVFVTRFEGGSDGAAAAAALPRIVQVLDERFDYPADWNKLAAPAFTSLRDGVVGAVQPVLISTLAAMAIILLIACANVAALMLGQLDARATELAVRSALGSSRSRMLQQVAAEAVIVGLAAGVVGGLVAVVAFRVLTGALPLGALAERAVLNWGVFGAALTIALLAALAVALVPSIALSRGDLRGSLATSRTAGVGARGGRLEGALVVVEVALAVLMAAGAALLIRSVANLRAIDAGVNTDEVAVLDIVAGAELGHEGRQRVLRELIPALESVPGVRAAAAIQKLPLRGRGWSFGIAVRGAGEEDATTTYYRMITPGYFDVMDQRLLAGRTFAAADEGGEPVVVINRALAERYFPGLDPVGRLISTGYDTAWARVIGVVADAADAGLTDEASPSRYMYNAQMPFSPEAWSLVLRTVPGRDPASVLGEARALVQAAHPTVAVQATTTMSEVFALAMGPARQLMGLLLLLAALAVVLGAVGVYGVVSHFVQQRRRDWGIRLALGLRPLRLIGQIVGRSGALVAFGVALGLAGSILLLRVLASFLYGVGAADPLALLLATVALFGIGLLAALIPAVRASRVDPAAVLREQ